jgi:hypothetical protein
MVKLTNVLCFGGGALFKSREMLWEREERQEVKKKKRKKYFRLQAAADSAALAKYISPALLKIWTCNASDH